MRDTFFRNLRYSIRALRRDAGFAIFAIVIAGLGIGSVTTVFSVANALLLRPLPFDSPSELVWIANRESTGLSGQTTQVAHLLDLRERSQSLESLAGYFAFYGPGDQVLTGRGEPERLSSVPVSTNFFDVLGVQPLHGRTFTDDEGLWRGPRAVLLSHAFWAQRFQSDPAILGTTLTLNEEPHTVAGILPASFDFGSVFAPGLHFDVFVPFPLVPETSQWGNTMAMIGRLRPGVTASEAQAEMQSLGVQLTQEFPNRNSFQGVVRPLPEHVSGRMRPAILILTAAVGVVMLIVCANLCNLLLARTATRQKEVAIRRAMGAGRGALLAQMLTEGLVLAGAGAVLGVVAAVVGTRALASLDAVSVPLLGTVQVDATALGATLLLVLVTGGLFGLAPAFQSSGMRLHDVLKDGTRGSTEGRGRGHVRRGLVVAEIAFACVLLVGAGLLIRSLVQVLDVNLGFDASRAAAIRVDPDRQYPNAPARQAYYDEVLRLARSVPGVESAGITDAVPLGRNRTWGVRVEGETYERGRAPSAFVRVVSDGATQALGIPVVAGRDISPGDAAGTEPIVVVNASMAAAVFPGQNPIGKVLAGLCGADRRVVGVVGDVRHLALEQDAGNEMYLPMRQCPGLVSADLVVRTTRAPAEIAGALRVALRPVVPTIASNEFRPLQGLVERAVSPRRFIVMLLVGFAGFALVLAALGIFALVSYNVNRRQQEFGIRLALGASGRSVTTGVLGETMRLAAAGVLVGGLASWWLAQSLGGLLYGVTSNDPITFAGMLVTLVLVALAAGYWPARRAARVEPIEALRG